MTHQRVRPRAPDHTYVRCRRPRGAGTALLEGGTQMRSITRTLGQLLAIAVSLLTAATPHRQVAGPAPARPEGSGTAVGTGGGTMPWQGCVATHDSSCCVVRPAGETRVPPPLRQAGR
ncbi:hypothetical protein MILUP08_42670 [Micromonospora lupini str. Lupac 08]|uniref:Uncharacterized protein n=1 Tax=Micromonospora lupini str. Lupac 08 TaxID=1150864 RepID=I0L1P2_9ACTN|nr:hypothetical protein MILUP08_42670 [Micromonospora lupini str. Lupac 08]